MMKVVGVIGAGAAGLCAARHISATPSMTPVVWEKTSKVGGTWVYSSHVGNDENGLPIHSSMYKNLKTNLPKELMAFPDFPFPEKEESFLPHIEVRNYLEDYTRHHELHQYIKLNHNVEEVKPIERDDGTTGWAVTVQDLESRTTTTTSCDSIIVCNGHYSVPKVPQIKGIEEFKGRQMHSHDYREPQPFTGLRVVVLGASASGLDITLELANVAKEVILSHNHPIPIPSELPPNVRQVRGVVEAYEDGFIFGDGSRSQADFILFCTGYKFTFPFLSEECGVTVEDNVVKPLYKHIINTAFPSMAFIGVPTQVVPFPIFDMQVKFFVRFLGGEGKPITREEMNSDIKRQLEVLRRGGGHMRHFHLLGLKGTENYINELALLADQPLAPPQLFLMFRRTAIRLVFSCLTFKQSHYSVGEDGTVKEWCDGREITTRKIIWLIVVRLVHTVRQDLRWTLCSLGKTLWHYLKLPFSLNSLNY